jgi:hypothetical protein
LRHAIGIEKLKVLYPFSSPYKLDGFSRHLHERLSDKYWCCYIYQHKNRGKRLSQY